MKILGIETSCDETAAAIIQADKSAKKVKVLSNYVATSLALHSKTGGIIPEVAAREQVKYIIPVIEKALEGNSIKDIDAIAVTVGPGLIGSLLVGIETAKTLSYIYKKPIIPVNHLFGHIYANFIENNLESRVHNSELGDIKFPLIALIVSGGHTDLVLMKNHRDYKWLGGTRDDAAGEAFDKTGRLLGLPYPAGPEIEKLSSTVHNDYYNFPKPLLDSNDYDFSFSGLKTAILREIQKVKVMDKITTSNICYSLQEAVFKILIAKTLKAAKQYKVKSILLGGGVASNQTLRKEFELEIGNLKLKIPLFVPEKRFCTDNAAMIAAAAFFNYKEQSWKVITANPELYFD